MPKSRFACWSIGMDSIMRIWRAKTLADDNFKCFFAFQRNEVDGAITIKQLLKYLDEM